MRSTLSEELFWRDLRATEPMIEPRDEPGTEEEHHFPAEGWYDSFGEWHYFEEEDDE